MFKLLVHTPGKSPFTVELAEFRTVIGRSVRNEVCLEDPFASRAHAEVRREGPVLRLTDLGSANGTLVNGARINGTVTIAPGDRLQIGGSVIEVQPLAGPAPEAALTVVGERLAPDAVAAVAAQPEALLTASDPPPGRSGLLSVIETIRSAAGADAVPPAAAQSQELMAVISKVGIALLSPSSLDEVLSQIMNLVFEMIPADRAFLFLLAADGRELVCKVACHRRRAPSPVDLTVTVSRSITEEVVGKGQSVLTSDALSDPRFRQQASIVAGGIRSIMAVPLAVNKQMLGMIYVDSLMSVNCFTEDDRRLVTAVASVAAIKIENALLLEQRMENERIRRQLQGARDLQARLLPVEPPAVAHYDLTGISFPCFEVGGDYFDFIKLPGGRLAVVLGDVSGKGMDAAMLMFSLHASLRAQASVGTPIAGLLAAVNSYLYESTPAHKFVTLFYGELDTAAHRLVYINAGHNPPFMIRAGGPVELLESCGMPIGLFANPDYATRSIDFEPGDGLVVYSDGITECTNDLGEEFGDARLIDTVKPNRHLAAAQLRDRIDEAVGQFVGKATPADDMSLVIIKRMSDEG